MDERDLPEEVRRLQRVHLAPVLDHVRGALDEHEELAAGLPLPGELLAFLEVDLVGDPADRVELALRAVREQRRPLEQLRLRILSQTHARSVKRVERVRADMVERSGRMLRLLLAGSAARRARASGRRQRSSMIRPTLTAKVTATSVTLTRQDGTRVRTLQPNAYRIVVRDRDDGAELPSGRALAERADEDRDEDHRDVVRQPDARQVQLPFRQEQAPTRLIRGRRGAAGLEENRSARSRVRKTDLRTPRV